MENVQTNQNSVPRNSILQRWKGICNDKGTVPAIFAPDGTVLRTFSDINAEAELWQSRFARFPAGAVISLQTGNVPELPALVIGAWHAGCCVLLCDLELKGVQRDNIEKLCGVQGRVEGGQGNCALIVRDHPPVCWPGQKPDLLKLTSGTTAEPRAICFTAAQLLADCDNVCETMGIAGDDRNYGVISFTHSYGFSNLITPLICRGVSLVVASDVLPRAVMKGLQVSQATVLPGVPALFRHLSEFSPEFPPPRLCISAGAPLTKDVADRFREQWKSKIHSFYGSSESGGICYDGEEAPQAEGYVGRPMKNVRIAFGDSGEESRIEVHSAAVGIGYWPEQAGDTLSDGVFRPADLLSREGNGYRIAGRVSDMINVAGRKVNPSEIEQVLRKCAGVREAAVIGVPSALRGEEVAACIAGSAAEADLREYCARALPGWQVPKKWVLCEKLPTNSRGKLNRIALRALF